MFTNIPGPGQEWKDQTSSASTLPTIGNQIGDARTVQDTGVLYTWDGSSWISTGGGGAGITSINSDTTSAQLIVAGTGISVSTATGTTTITNTISGGVTTTGSPATNYLSVFSGSNTITGTSSLEYDGTTLALVGNQSATKNIITGSFGSNSPITQGFNSGFWTSREGDVITFMFNDPEVGRMGFLDEIESSGYNFYEFKYRTADPSKVAFGNGGAVDLMVFNHLPATDQFLFQMNPTLDTAASICAQNGSITFPAYTFNTAQTTGMYLVPNGLNTFPSIYFSGPGDFGGVSGVYVNGLVGSQSDGGGGFFGNGYISPDITGSMAFYYDPDKVAIRVQATPDSFSILFSGDGDLLFSNQDQGIPLNSNIGDALGHAPISLFVGQGGLQLLSLSGSNNSSGTATLVGGTITVSNTAVGSNTQIMLSVSTAGGTQGFLSTARSIGTSFTITSSSILDTSTVEWVLIEKF